jgi:alkanesulfonate monooxygenase SsuD/methylene tetrahydromethanopterin reductase-like flavin-dependent oxidoreductase (luciferase family)
VFIGVSCGGEFWGLDVFRSVEELGYDGLFTGEHLLFHRPVWDAVSMCTAMACATDRIVVGPAATIAPLRHPTLLAKEFVGVDRISGGRLVLGLGVGGDNPREFDAAAVPLERRGHRTSETVEILKRYFSGERFSYGGEIFRLDEVKLDPPPARPGGPPIWIAGRQEPTRRRAALLGDGFLPYMVTADSCRRMFDSVEALADQGGRELPPGYAWCAYLYVAVGDDAAEARGRADAHLAWRYDEPRFTGDLAGKYAIAGRAEDCAEGLARFAAIGCTHVILSLVRREREPPTAALEEVARSVLPLLAGRN